MQGNPAVVSALIDVYNLLRTTEEQSHLQEHSFEVQGWKSSKWWDCIENKLHENCLHFVINRINELGGLIKSTYPFDPVYYPDDFQAALRVTVDALTRCRDAYAVACDAAVDDGDYVTTKMIYGHVEWIEGRIIKFEGRILRYGKLGTVVMTGAL